MVQYIGMTSTAEVAKKAPAKKSVSATKTTPKRPSKARARKTPAKKTPTKKTTVKEAATKAPKKRTAAKAKKASVAKKTAPKTLAPEVTTEEDMTSEKDTATSVQRKAPTAFAARARATLKKRRQFIVVGMLLLLGVGSSAAVGFTDTGRIDINQIIAERNARINANAGTADDLAAGSKTIPVQNTSSAPDGGLIGLMPSPTVPKKPASTTASTTLALATTTASSSDASGDVAAPTAEVAGVASSSAAVSPEPEPALRPEETVINEASVAVPSAGAG